MAECHMTRFLQAGFFIRAMECNPFNIKSNGSVAWDIRVLNSTWAGFPSAFRSCCASEMSRSRAPAATSFLQSGLPIKAYADNFGYMIRARQSTVECAYAFDAYQVCPIGCTIHSW